MRNVAKGFLLGLAFGFWIAGAWVGAAHFLLASIVFSIASIILTWSE